MCNQCRTLGDIWDMNGKYCRKSQSAASLFVSASLQTLMKSALVAYRVNMIRQDSFLYVLSSHINIFLHTHTFTCTPTVYVCGRERERERKEQQTENIVEQLPKTPKGLDCSLLIPLSQHVPMLKYHSVGLVQVLSVSSSCQRLFFFI